jgi:hypothetical protein
MTCLRVIHQPLRSVRAAAKAVLPAVALLIATGAWAGPAPVQVVPDETAHRVNVTVGGQPFTAYRFEAELKKPVLYPLRSAGGKVVTRGAPIEPQPGEPTDHPHHVGSWLTYGNVNGVDIWNKKGAIRHQRVVRAEGGTEQGVLDAEAEWLGPDGKAMLLESTRFIFRGAENLRAFDRITTLTAQDARVVFKDNKEGMFGLRVAKSLQGDNAAGDKGVYRSSEGMTGNAVWSTRGRWVTLAGKVGGDPVTIAIFDHPKNPNHPTYWHARPYGLFAANPFGQSIFDPKAQPLNFTLDPKQSTTFRYRVLIHSGVLGPDPTEERYKQFAAEGP